MGYSIHSYFIDISFDRKHHRTFSPSYCDRLETPDVVLTFQRFFFLPILQSDLLRVEFIPYHQWIIYDICSLVEF